ncbi:bifunctional 3-deoxy-7-phosphoheptulonate synthase/chorismate mutase type II [Pontibacter ruber]|uniref:Bifunctional 3-deoxy-7-phosphoheptulonate synthase/chorismate mutase type II n=1 Tax=Pontibacter ruber TaxID=1343895 RepID=A0ABW5CX54_9BACT|nr:bifunctional 3-deoxy-7-phosphoheptulonate synthase/chorismate mutase type II [Pontibacter ruber]
MRASKTTINVAPQSSFRNESGKPVLIAGPCSAESEEQMLQTAQLLKKNQDITIFKAGIWKSRTRPNNFEGVGLPGLLWLDMVKKETGLRTACDVANAQQTDEALRQGVDILCISGRATVNPFAVQEIAEALRGTDTPVLVNNPVYPDLRLWVGAFERLEQANLSDLGAIHRGYSGEDHDLYRSHPKWEHMLQLRRELPELPVLCDSSHIAGKRSLLYPVSQRALDLGVDGLLFESHVSPAEALSSQQQQLMPQELELLINALATRVKLSETAELVDQLDILRQQVESLDNELMELLLRRSAVTRQLSTNGLGSSMQPLQANRWQGQLESLLQQTGNNNLAASVVKAIGQPARSASENSLGTSAVA